ncbi:nodulation protein NfeD [Actinomyces sp. ZJ308]|uniref:nodulation protein NfeD n=1 Tax=Actinomyces sp. ZJ308 TaxID=2708342 RepID=UPI0014246B13|nr:nodulation protein NfeD [Actinomyces sp. ZJ308]
MSIFAWCAIIGCVTLLAGVLFDGLLDAFLPDGMVPVLALPVAVFGAIGMGMTAMSGSASMQVPAAVVWGVPTTLALASGAVTRWLWNHLRRTMPLDTAPPTAAELIGERVTVLWWKDGSGEVRAITRGNQLTLPARSEEPLRSGQSAWVLDAEDSTLTITPWEQIDS